MLVWVTDYVVVDHVTARNNRILSTAGTSNSAQVAFAKGEHSFKSLSGHTNAQHFWLDLCL